VTHEHLVEQALHLPRREAARWRHTRFDQEDLVGDGNLALVKAARRYDPNYGVPFPAFALRYVRGAILDAIRSRARRNALGDGTYADVISLNDLGPSADGEERQSYDPPDPRPTPDATVESLERLRVLATLPPSERVALVRTAVDGETAAQTGARLFLSSETVKSYRKRVIAKLGARNGTHAVALALRSGLLPIRRPMPAIVPRRVRH
jgi:RNA polymerase sigma factor (sigma-70 family)